MVFLFFGIFAGLSEVGSMLGADIVTVTSTDETHATVDDRYVPWTSFPLMQSPLPFPILDTFNNWQLKCFTSSATTLTAVVNRALNTHDGQDRPITAGSLPVIFAWGGYGALAYHGANRGSSEITFFGPAAPAADSAPSDTTSTVVLGYNAPWVVQPVVTQYVCQIIDLGAAPRHITKIESVYDSTAGDGILL